MKRTFRTQARLLAMATTAVLLLAACGGSDGATPIPPNSTGGATAEAPSNPDAQATVVNVSAVEFAYDLPQGALSPGTHTFVLENQGTMAHDLVIEGPGVTASTSLIGPGETTEVTVTLEAGEYVLWCSVSGHRSQGMETTITVG